MSSSFLKRKLADDLEMTGRCSLAAFVDRWTSPTRLCGFRHGWGQTIRAQRTIRTPEPWETPTCIHYASIRMSPMIAQLRGACLREEG